MFKQSATSTGILLWVGDPDCLAAYKKIQEHLRKHVSAWLSKTEKLGSRRKGNLGEYITFQCACEFGLNGPDHHVFLSNAKTPLADISTHGLDLSYVYLDPKGDISKDLLYIQEVKTTRKKDLKYAENLVEDYRKLFAPDPDFALANRVAQLKTILELERKQPRAVLERVEQLFGPNPSGSVQVRLVPTVVHERNGSDPETILVAVRAEIKALGWAATQIEPWSIALGDLQDGLTKLARNEF